MQACELCSQSSVEQLTSGIEPHLTEAYSQSVNARQMHGRTLLVFTLWAAVGGCAQLPSPEGDHIDMGLLDGEAVFGYTVEPAPV